MLRHRVNLVRDERLNGRHGGGALGLDFYLLEVFRQRLESPDLRRAIIRSHERHGAAATQIEETELGRALAQDLYQTGHLRAITLRRERDKLARLLAQAARFEAGQVHLPQNAPWLATYLNEVLGFPNAPHDDQVDSTSQALNWLTARKPTNRPIVRRDISRRNIVQGDIKVIGMRADGELGLTDYGDLQAGCSQYGMSGECSPSSSGRVSFGRFIDFSVEAHSAARAGQKRAFWGDQ